MDVGDGLGPRREAFDVRNIDGVEGDLVWMEIEILEVELSFSREQNGNAVASGGELVGEVDERRNVACGKPGEHGYVKFRHCLKVGGVFFSGSRLVENGVDNHISFGFFGRFPEMENVWL